MFPRDLLSDKIKTINAILKKSWVEKYGITISLNLKTRCLLNAEQRRVTWHWNVQLGCHKNVDTFQDSWVSKNLKAYKCHQALNVCKKPGSLQVPRVSRTEGSAKIQVSHQCSYKCNSSWMFQKYLF